jgi:hypothetical protein
VLVSFDRQPEIIDFLADNFGPYPFSAAGGIVDNVDVGFALENQTRPVYSPGFFGEPGGNDWVVVHELAHQWRRQPHRRHVAAHLAQRRLRDLCRMAVERGSGLRNHRRDLRRLGRHSGGRPVLGAPDRRPGSGQPVRLRGLRTRRPDARGAAPGGG